MDYKKKDTAEKALKEVDKGITVCTYERGEIVEEYSTGESGSVQYPNKDSIINEEDLLRHSY